MNDSVTGYLKFTRLLMIYHLVERMGGNIILSPFSIQMLLSLLADATAGTAHDEVMRALQGRTIGRGSAGRGSTTGQGSAGRGGTTGQGSAGRGGVGRRGMTGQEMMEWLVKMQRRMKRTQVFASSNALCIRQDIEPSVNSEFRDLLKNNYDGEIFSSRNMVRDVNRWAERVSHGMINEIADESMADALAFMLNCVSFEAEWYNPYKEIDIGKSDFTNADGSVKRVHMMGSTEEYYLENKYFTGFLRPYKYRDFYFMGLLPKKEAIEAFNRKEQTKKEAIEAFNRKEQTKKEGPAPYQEVQQVSPNRDFWTHALYETDFRHLFHSRTDEYELHVVIPEFKADFSTNLERFCNELGMKDIFSGGADFSPMTSEEIYLESIIQKACIEVDRYGTRATAISMGALPKCYRKHEKKVKYVRLDRPFLYAIVECENGMPIFEGILNYI